MNKQVAFARINVAGLIGSLSIKVCLYYKDHFRHSLPHVVKVREDESLVDIKATGNDVLGIFHCEAMAVLHC